MKSDVRRKDKELRKKKTGNNKEEVNYKGAEGGEPGSKLSLIWIFPRLCFRKIQNLFDQSSFDISFSLWFIIVLPHWYIQTILWLHNFFYNCTSKYKKRRKFAEASVGSRKLAEISAPSRGKWILLMKSAKESKLVSIWQIFVWGIDEWFKFKTESFHLIWSSRNAFGNNHYFKIQISHFLAIFQLTFFPRGIPQSRLRLSSWWVEIVLFSRI